MYGPTLYVLKQYNIPLFIASRKHYVRNVIIVLICFDFYLFIYFFWGGVFGTDKK